MNGQDKEHLNLLGIFHYVLGGITGLFACFPCIHLSIGIAFVSGAFKDGRGQGPPPEVGWFFIAIASVLIVMGWTLAILILTNGGRLRKHRSYTFAFVVACIECVMMPMGTVLGVFTIIVLSRPGVKSLFQSGSP